MTNTPVQKPKRRVLPVVTVLTLLLIGGALGIWWQFQPASNTPRPVPVTIEKGASVEAIGRTLRSAGVIRSPFAFRWTARSQGGDRIKAGRYTLSPDMGLAQILQKLQQGPEEPGDGRIRVTIPEGYTLRQIADTLERNGITDKSKFLAIATNPNQIARLHPGFPLPKKTLEGYLYPDTYYFRRNTPPMQVIESLVTNFNRRFVRPYQQEIRASGHALHPLVTAASLIEREARVPEDRARIAGVLDNRLKKGMRLEIDATVLYALGEHKDRVLYRDLKVDSPYNTYRNKGLPPGPIANPGLEALKAALKPEQHTYLYYVARPDGAHIFTSTLAAHQAAIRKVRAERAALERQKEATPGG